jgi:phosphoenolpyruvate carboxylase
VRRGGVRGGRADPPRRDPAARDGRARRPARAARFPRPGGATDVIRGFSTYFQVVNIAERVHRIRRRREWLRDHRQLRSDSLEAAMRLLASAIPDPAEAKAFLDGLLIEPVFTAHPTEPTRRTMLLKQQQIARRLVERMDTSLTPQEQATLLANIRAQVTSGLADRGTPEHPHHRQRRARAGAVLPRREHLPGHSPVYEHLEQAIADVWGHVASTPPPRHHFPLRQLGRRRHGRQPNVGPDTIRETLALHRRTALELYRAELRKVARELSQSPSRVGFSPALMAQLEAYGRISPTRWRIRAAPPRHALPGVLRAAGAPARATRRRAKAAIRMRKPSSPT